MVLSLGWPCYNGKARGNWTTTRDCPSTPNYSAFIAFHCVSDSRSINFNTTYQPDSDPAPSDNCRTVADQDAYTNHTHHHSFTNSDQYSRPNCLHCHRMG